MCFEAPEPFKRGSVLYIQMNNEPTDQIYHGSRRYLRTSTLGEVKWIAQSESATDAGDRALKIDQTV